MKTLVIVLVALGLAYLFLLNSDQKDVTGDIAGTVVGAGSDFVKGGINAVKNDGDVSSEEICGGKFCVNISKIGG